MPGVLLAPAEFGQNASVRGDLFIQIAVGGWIADIWSAAHDRVGLSSGGERTLMAAAVDTDGQTADNEDTGAGKFRGCVLSDNASVMRAPACTDDRYRRSVRVSEVLLLRKDRRAHRRLRGDAWGNPVRQQVPIRMPARRIS